VWTCPRCQRRFRTVKQWHSCEQISVAAFFWKHEQLLPVFEALLRKLRGLGEVEAEALPTSIHLGIRGGARFAGISLRKDHLRVGFQLERELPGAARIVQRGQLGRRTGYAVALRRTADVDAELLGWLREAHALKHRG